MNLEFGILWIEDSFSEAEEARLREAAVNAGFEANITNSIDGANLDELAQEQQIYHPFDLILLDLNLAGGVKGDALASRVRELFHSTPILFYSGSCEEIELRRRMADDKIEGVFCAHRGRFVERASEMISDLSQSLNRLSGMRGLAMEVVATTDLLCKEVVIALHNQGIADGFDERVSSEVVRSANQIAEDFPKIDGLISQLEHRAVDSMKLFGLFRDLLRAFIRDMDAGEQKDHLRALRGATNSFRDDVILKRNVLGHAKETRSDDGWAILDSDENVIMTADDFPELRRVFLSNLKAIRAIHQLLVS